MQELVQVESLAQVGVQLLLFTLGLEFSLQKLKAVRSVALIGLSLSSAELHTHSMALTVRHTCRLHACSSQTLSQAYSLAYWLPSAATSSAVWLNTSSGLMTVYPRSTWLCMYTYAVDPVI